MYLVRYQYWVSLFEWRERAAPTLQVEKVVWNVGVYFSSPVRALFQLRLMRLPETLQWVPGLHALECPPGRGVCSGACPGWALRGRLPCKTPTVARKLLSQSLAYPGAPRKTEGWGEGHKTRVSLCLLQFSPSDPIHLLISWQPTGCWEVRGSLPD